jgi:predicted lipoprotein with Yx(FWY)xxD motif
MLRSLFTAILITVAMPAAASSAEPKATVKSYESEYGRIVVDGTGRTLYGFTKDRRKGPSRCGGECAEAWPPFIVDAKPQAGAGAKGKRIGVRRRRSGKLQATYGGHPLYYYVGEDEPYEILCQDVFEFGGDWLIVAPTGRLVR